MKRFASQWLLCPDLAVLKNNMIEVADDDVIVRVADLHGQNSETAGTVFLNGVIAPGIISLLQRKVPDSLVIITGKTLFRIVDGQFESVFPGTKDDFILDFGTENPQEVNVLLRNNLAFLKSFSLEKLIHACTFAPAAFVQGDISIVAGAQIKLTAWENVDFINHRLTENTRVCNL